MIVGRQPRVSALRFVEHEGSAGRGEPTAANESMGLGLFIVREIVKAHGGTVDVRSDPSSTSFTVRLPPSACRPGDARVDNPLIH